MTRRRRCGRYAAWASARLRSSSAATACNAVPSAIFWWTTCANASPRWTTTSLKSLACTLGMLFWQDLERHNPGISSLHLSAEVAGDWKQRLRTKPKTITSAAGEKTQAQVPRLELPGVHGPGPRFLPGPGPVGCRYPSRWGPWAVPCPIREQETGRRKARRHRKSRMDARTRERLPVLPVLIQTVNERRTAAQALLETARRARHSESFTAAGQTLTRVVTRHGTTVGRVWAADRGTGNDVTLPSRRNRRSGRGRSWKS